MPAENNLPPHVKTWEQTNPKAFEIYNEAFQDNLEAKIPVIQKIIEPIAQKTVDNMNSHPEDIWKIFKQAAHELEDPTDTNQITALYDAVYTRLDLLQKQKLAYHMAY
ncbi:MAG: hypothetical protein C5S40_04780 [ANME-2 cluster archaeon]|nr:hypothetical protein [ANME-2 cluster archaeon]